jgi:hypothetical protein
MQEIAHLRHVCLDHQRSRQKVFLMDPRPARSLHRWTRAAADFCLPVSDWLHMRRIMGHALIAALVMWIVIIANMAGSGLVDRFGKLKGIDFLQFYAAATMLKVGHISALYDIPKFWQACQRAVPSVNSAFYFPVYPPQVTLIFLPFSYLSYLQALAVWSSVSVVLYTFCLFLIAKKLPAIGNSLALMMVAFAFPPLFYTIAMGQISMLPLLCISVAMVEYTNGHELTAGLALGCTLLKPPLFLTVSALLFVLRGQRLLLGLAMSAFAQAALTVIIFGSSTICAYANLLMTLLHSNITVLAVKPFLMQSLRGFWLAAGAGPIGLALWAVSATPIFILLVRFWPSERERAVRFAALMIAVVLVDPHLYVYDEIVVGPALAVIVDRCCLGERRVALLLKLEIYVFMVTLFLIPVTRYLHVQVSVLVLCILFCTLTVWPFTSFRRSKHWSPQGFFDSPRPLRPQAEDGNVQLSLAQR